MNVQDYYNTYEEKFGETHIVYMSNQPLSDSTTIRGTLNDNFFEVSPINQHFFHIPITYNDNTISLEVCTYNEQWEAKPIAMLKRSYSINQYTLLMPWPSSSFFENEIGLQKLTYNHKFETHFNLQVMKSKAKKIQYLYSRGLGEYKILYNGSCAFLNGCRVLRKNLEYKIGKYFVCYERTLNFRDRVTGKFKKTKFVNYRIGNDIHVNQSSFTNKLDRYHYLTLDKKTIPMNSVIFYSKINDNLHFVKLLRTMVMYGFTNQFEKHL